MQKISYIGNGKTTEFYFNFPYFENSNIVVTVNNQFVKSYSVIGTSGGLDADIPYTGGKVVFNNAPSRLDSIVIARQLPVKRIADYQPSTQVNNTILNQDLNYLLELIKDRKYEVEALCSQYADIADKESTDVLLARINAIHNEIATISQQMTEFGDLSQINADITALKTQTTGILDYVVASQSPSAENGYTWYRKYKSGWVEQGMLSQTLAPNIITLITLPIPMAGTNYTVSTSCSNINSEIYADTPSTISAAAASATTFRAAQYNTNNYNLFIQWEVKGMAA